MVSPLFHTDNLIFTADLPSIMTKYSKRPGVYLANSLLGNTDVMVCRKLHELLKYKGTVSILQQVTNISYQF